MDCGFIPSIAADGIDQGKSQTEMGISLEQ
jgi:hypothetical protein